jgi:hypothetical protein
MMENIMQLSKPEREYYQKTCIDFMIQKSVLDSIHDVIHAFIMNTGMPPTHVLLHPALSNLISMETRHCIYGGNVKSIFGCKVMITAACKIGCGILEVKE